MYSAKIRSTALVLSLGLCCIFVVGATISVVAQRAPVYKFDPTWPKLPLPNKWTAGNESRSLF